MPAKLPQRAALIVTRLDDVESVEIVGLHIDLGVTPSVHVELEAVRVVDLGDAQADPPREKSVASVSLPPVIFTGPALEALLGEATAATMAARNIYAGIKAALYARLQADGVIPEGVEVE